MRISPCALDFAPAPFYSNISPIISRFAPGAPTSAGSLVVFCFAPAPPGVLSSASDNKSHKFTGSSCSHKFTGSSRGPLVFPDVLILMSFNWSDRLLLTSLCRNWSQSSRYCTFFPAGRLINQNPQSSGRT